MAKDTKTKAASKPRGSRALKEAVPTTAIQGRRHLVLDAVIEAFQKARGGANDYGDPTLRLTTDILEGLISTLRRVDEAGTRAALGKGATWGRKQIRSAGDFDRPRKPVELARLLKLTDASPMDIAVMVLSSGLVSPAGLVAAEIQRAFDDARKNGITDRELIVKRMLMYSGVSENDANNFVSSAFRKDD